MKRRLPAEPPRATPRVGGAAAKIILAAAFAFAALGAIMTFFQDELLFPTHAVAPADPLPPGAERLAIETPDGERLHGVHIPPTGGAKSRTLVLGFGGNAWNGENVASYLHELYPGVHVVAFHYRGYRPSTGKPSADALIADAPLALAAAREKVKPTKVVAAGFSIGSGVAASLARDEIDGVILVTPFDSLKKVASELYPWLPVGLAFRHEMDAAAYLKDTAVPVAIVAAERDDIIPPSRTEALREQVPALAFDTTIAGAGHNDIYARSDFQHAMREALKTVSGN